MPPQRETSSPRHADGTPRPSLRTLTLRTLGAAALGLPVVAAPFVLTSAAAPTDRPDRAAAALAAASQVEPVDKVALAERDLRASRSMAPRLLTPVTMKPRAVDHQWASAPLNVWPQPGERGKPLRVLRDGSKIAVTGQTSGHWAEALVAGRARWVNKTYLQDTKPVPPAPVRTRAASTSTGSTSSSGSSGSTGSTGSTSVSGISSAPCADGSGTESGITGNAVVMFRAICAAFPPLSSYGGYDGHGEHADGRAVDFMVSSSSLGSAVAEWARANAGALHIRTIIWSQHIWTPERSAEGWRSMSDRGSATANHYDHVHISVY